jgi:hypothetical protein
MVFNQCRTIKIITRRQIWDQVLAQKVFKWAKVGDMFFKQKKNFHKGFELVAPLANKILLPKKMTRRYQYFWVLLCKLWA